MAEVVKAAMVGDAELFEELERVAGDELYASGERMERIVRAAIEVKRGIVEQDMREGSIRRKLNLGHTIAHALEKCTRSYNHGEAVAMGLVLAARLSDRVFRGDMDTPTALEGSVAIDLCDCGLYPECPFTVEQMAEIMAKDKKAEGGKVHFVLLNEIGDVTTYALTVDEVVKLLK